MKETNFKQTDIGTIPKDWEVKKISEVSDIVTGATPSTKNPNYWNNGNIRWMSSGELNNKIIYDVQGRITQEGYNHTGTHLLPKHCILIGLAGQGKTRGTVAYNEIELCTNQSIAAILPNDDTFNYLYLYYHLNSQYDLLRMLSAGDGGRGGLNKQILLNFQIPLPPTLAEQKRIAEALTSIDNLISSLNSLIDKKKNIKQGTMQQLLTAKLRLKGFNKEWVEKKLGEIGDLTGAGVDKLSHPNEKPVRLINYLDVFHRDHIYNNELKMWVTANDMKLSNCNVLQGDVFFTPSSEMPYDIAFSAVAMEDMVDVCYSYHIYRLRFHELIDLKYKAYMFKNKKFYEQANTLCEGSGKRYVISLSKFKEMTIMYPSDIAEQRAIAEILTAMDKEINLLEEKKSKYQAIKQGMMQQLLTGKIRLIN